MAERTPSLRPDKHRERGNHHAVPEVALNDRSAAARHQVTQLLVGNGKATRSSRIVLALETNNVFHPLRATRPGDPSITVQT